MQRCAAFRSHAVVSVMQLSFVILLKSRAAFALHPKIAFIGIKHFVALASVSTCRASRSDECINDASCAE